MFGSKVTTALPVSEVEGSEFAVSNPDEDVLIEREAVHEYFNQNNSDNAVAVKDVEKIYKASQTMKKMKAGLNFNYGSRYIYCNTQHT